MNKIHDWFANPDNAIEFHGTALIIWLIAAIPIALLMANSIPFIVFISVYAIVISHWSSYQAVRTELKQDGADIELKELVSRLRKIDPDHPQDTV